MVDRRPLKVDPSGISEFLDGDIIPVTLGGTGVSSLGLVDGSSLNVALSSLTDVSSSITPSSHSYLIWDGSEWTASGVPAGGGGGGGETNTGSNVGTGESVFKQKSGVDLEFYAVSGQSGVSAILDSANNNVNISAIPSQIDHTELSAVGVCSHAELDDHTTSSTVHFLATEVALSGLSDVVPNVVPTSGDVLTWDGNQWCASTLDELDEGGYVLTDGSKDIVGNQVIEGELEVSSNLTVSSDIGVSGSVWIGTSAVVSGDLTVSTDAHVSGDIWVEGTVDGRNVATDGTNQDSHIADATLHFTEGSIDHGSIAGLGDNDHPQYLLTADNANTSANAVLIDGSRDIVGNQVIEGELEVSSNLTASSDLGVSGDVWIGTNATVSGDLTVSTNANVSGDATVEGNFYLSGTLGDELDAGSNSIGCTSVSSGRATANTIDWRDGNKQGYLADGDATLTFTAPTKPGNFMLRILQDGTGGRTITLPTILWPGGNAPTLTTTAHSTDIISLFYDGAEWFGVASLDFS